MLPFFRMDASLHGPATARLVAPRVSLASCVRACLLRNTMHRPELPREQRLNRFPASPHCSLTWFIQGTCVMVDPPPELPPRPSPPVLFAGPQERPTISYNPGQVHAFMVLFFPQAMHALTGLDISRHVNEFSLIEDVLDAGWQAMAREVSAAPDDAARIALLEQFLEPRWQAARARGAAPGHLIGDWVQALSLHAATSSWGRSVRHLERRIKAWAGQPMRRLRRLSRAEHSFLRTRDALTAGDPVAWAELAAEDGYSDQAHLCREVRDITGHSLTELARAARSDDESYWVYRIWS